MPKKIEYLLEHLHLGAVEKLDAFRGTVTEDGGSQRISDTESPSGLRAFQLIPNGFTATDNGVSFYNNASRQMQDF